MDANKSKWPRIAMYITQQVHIIKSTIDVFLRISQHSVLFFVIIASLISKWLHDIQLNVLRRRNILVVKRESLPQS